MKLATVGNGKAVHMYYAFTSKEITVDGKTSGGIEFRNTQCGVQNHGSNFGARTNNVINVFEGEFTEVTCKRCLRSEAAKVMLEPVEETVEEEMVVTVVEAPVVEAKDTFQEDIEAGQVGDTITDRNGHLYKITKRRTIARTGMLRVSVENSAGLEITFGFAIKIAPKAPEPKKVPRAIPAPVSQPEPVKKTIQVMGTTYTVDGVLSNGVYYLRGPRNGVLYAKPVDLNLYVFHKATGGSALKDFKGIITAKREDLASA